MEENKPNTEGHTPSHEKKETHHEHKPVQHSTPSVHPTQHTPKTSGSSFFKNHIWKVTTGVLAVALIISLLIPGFSGIGATEAGNRAIAAINSELQGQATASLLSVQEENGLYNARINVQGQILDTYITKDGKLLFPQAIAINDIKADSGAGTPTNGNDNTQPTGNIVRRDVNTEGAYFIGEEDAPVTVVEFSDFECPFCSRAYSDAVAGIKENYVESGQVKFVYMHFPLNSIHPRAEPAALASECAGEQGKFWEYHDLLFENQRSLSDSDLKQHAADLDLNTDQFNDCLDSKKYLDKVNAHLAEGSSNGVSGTPGFFVNGRPLSGAQPFSAFQPIIEQELGNEPLPAPTQDNGNMEQHEATGRVDVKVEGSYFIGEEDAPVTVVEFSDFQCPFCQRSYNDAVQQLKKEYVETGQVKFVYRHFPLSFHEQATPAAEASECAGEQGDDKFWEFHDLAFENQGQLSPATYEQWAEDIGLDVTQFTKCVESGKYSDKVSNDFSEGQSLGVSGTPTFFINGNKVVGAVPYAQIKSAVEAEL